MGKNSPEREEEILEVELKNLRLVRTVALRLSDNIVAMRDEPEWRELHLKRAIKSANVIRRLCAEVTKLKTNDPRLVRRDQQIASEWANIDVTYKQLAKKYRLSPCRVRNIVLRQALKVGPSFFIFRNKIKNEKRERRRNLWLEKRCVPKAVLREEMRGG